MLYLRNLLISLKWLHWRRAVILQGRGDPPVQNNAELSSSYQPTVWNTHVMSHGTSFPHAGSPYQFVYLRFNMCHPRSLKNETQDAPKNAGNAVSFKLLQVTTGFDCDSTLCLAFFLNFRGNQHTPAWAWHGISPYIDFQWMPCSFMCHSVQFFLFCFRVAFELHCVERSLTQCARTPGVSKTQMWKLRASPSSLWLSVWVCTVDHAMIQWR